MENLIFIVSCASLAVNLATFITIIKLLKILVRGVEMWRRSDG